jgi:very-short-patch-repair endonuclease
MAETFTQYLKRWLSHSTERGLNNPLVKMPVKRFRKLQAFEFSDIADGGSLPIGTTSDPIARNLLKNFTTRIRERGERCAFLCFGSVEVTIAGGVDQQPRSALFPVCLKKASLSASGQNVRANVGDNENWVFNPVLRTHLRNLGIAVEGTLTDDPNPVDVTNWVKSQLTNRAVKVEAVGYVGLVSSQQMVIQERFEDPRLCQVLAENPVIKAKLEGRQTDVPQPFETTDEGLEDLGMVLPCDDSQLRVVQLSARGCSLQVEGPPGTGKSQTIANIISNAFWRGRSVLLVCDKKEAVAQVEERLACAGLKPALLNLHDEGLDKKEFLRQATEKFSGHTGQMQYPFAQLSQTREILNGRVRFGRKICHAAMQVSNAEALGGLIRLKKELGGNVPPLDIANWQAISSERLAPLLQAIGGWPGFAAIATNSTSLWNHLRTEAFANNPFVENDLTDLSQKILAQLDALNELREMTASVGADSKLASDADAAAMLALAEVVLQRPACHHGVVGNRDVSLPELSELQRVWSKRDELVKARHPVPLDVLYPAEAEQEAKALLASERCMTWRDMSERAEAHDTQRADLEATQPVYQRLCDRLGLVYSPLLKFRRAQLEAVLRLGTLQCSIPRSWWSPQSTPVHSVTGWIGQLRACGQQAVTAPSRLHFTALERIAATHWAHVEAKAENGFNRVSYCLKFVNDRKCKFALYQVYPEIPARGFKGWWELTLHAISTQRIVASLREASEVHVLLTQLTANYLAVGHEQPDKFEEMLAHEDVKRLEAAAALVEQLRSRNDLFDLGGVHWQTIWEAPNHRLLGEVQALLNAFDGLVFPDCQSDHVENAIQLHKHASERLRNFLETWARQAGDRAQPILSGIGAQREFARCNERLRKLEDYRGINAPGHAFPDWEFVRESIAWRDMFERLSGVQRLDIDRRLWSDIQSRLKTHQASLAEAYERLNHYFEKAGGALTDYGSLVSLVGDIQAELPRHPLWLEKKKWQEKIRGAYPELVSLWGKVTEGTVKPEHAKRLFCFNLLRLCNPITKPDGADLRQTLETFIQQDERLTEWTVNDLKRKLTARMEKAEAEHATAFGRLKYLDGLQKRPALRSMLNNGEKGYVMDFLLKFKPCWMMSPTSLANLVDLSVFDSGRAPFDLVIFDEASQIRVLDGLLSMSFGAQVIVVGDEHQLPPDDDFRSLYNPDDDDGDEESLSESLLNEFKTPLRAETLLSHYRSETPDLIRFSNERFYRGKLELFPPAYVSGIGRRLHYVKNAVYSETEGQRNNRKEAEEVVSLVGAHVRDLPDKSLGVVTMNISQMELIEDLLQSAPQSVQMFCSDDAKFFVRNLQTVQGDEMDRIIVSLTYGKNPAGHFNAAILRQFTKRGGARRLNVAITRSRSGMTVVSSMTSADLASSSATSEGFLCLKAFLADLEAGATASGFGITSERFQKRNNGVSNVVFCESPFEEQVVEFLENLGFELECQYGCGEFRLDIVVKDRGKNLLAIECDGAAYHSSLVARTRDRARQRILETRGWRGRIHRVWSTNWWQYETQEKEGILAAISAARQAQQSAGSRTKSVHRPNHSTASDAVHGQAEGKDREPAEVAVDYAGDVHRKPLHADEGPLSQPPSPLVPVGKAVPAAPSPALGRTPRASSQAQPGLDLPEKIGDATVTGIVRDALYLFIPSQGKIRREELLESVSTHLGLPLKAARPKLNRLIYDEKRAGRIELDSGWENVWLASPRH